MTVEVAELKLTCSAAPSQWEGRLVDGRPIYIRYRWGTLQIHFGPIGGTVDQALDAKPWFEDDVGDNMGAVISLPEVAEYSGLIVPQAILADRRISNG
ncbi:MAG: hypothetical protein HY859_10450 [Caulobacterales bacterium]|nr:hypothetical protein [Caulobacterales bacterium]